MKTFGCSRLKERALATRILFHSAENYERQTSAAMRNRHFGDTELSVQDLNASAKIHSPASDFYSGALLRPRIMTRVDANLKAVMTKHGESALNLF